LTTHADPRIHREGVLQSAAIPPVPARRASTDATVSAGIGLDGQVQAVRVVGIAGVALRNVGNRPARVGNQVAVRHFM